MLRHLLLSTIVLSLLPGSRSLPGDDKDEIKKLIPAAAAMPRAEFEKMAASGSTPKADDFTNQSLTLRVFSMKLIAEPSKEQTKEFELLGDDATPKPSDLAEEVYRSVGRGKLRFVLAPVTIIHADRITDFTCEVKGDTATGTVSFKVPKLYQGTVQYVAGKKEEMWQITELKLPAHNIHIVRDKEETWQQAEQKE